MAKDQRQFLTGLLNFTKFLHAFQQVERTILATGTDRDENDAEHAYQIAMVGWYINSTYNLNLDTEKILKYALVHDLVEVYAGDTYFHTTDQTLKDSKAQREVEARHIIARKFPEFPEITKLMEDCEGKINREACFVYALDKIMPTINIFLDHGKSWLRDKVTYQMVRTKDEKVAQSPEIDKIWKSLIQLFESQPELFYSDDIK